MTTNSTFINHHEPQLLTILDHYSTLLATIITHSAPVTIVDYEPVVHTSRYYLGTMELVYI